MDDLSTTDLTLGDDEYTVVRGIDFHPPGLSEDEAWDFDTEEGP